MLGKSQVHQIPEKQQDKTDFTPLVGFLLLLLSTNETYSNTDRF